jgi:hypothetical protein
MIKSNYISDILELLLDGDSEGILARKQLEYLSEENFDYTGSGVFVKFSHTETAKELKTKKADLILNGVEFISSEYPVQGEATLFFKNGIIDYLEIWCYNGEDYPKKDLIKYTLTQTWIGSMKKVITTETLNH